MPSEEITWGEKDRTRPTLNLFQGQEGRFPLQRSRWDCQIGAPIKTRREKERAKNVIRDSLRMKRPFLRPLFLILSPFSRWRRRTQSCGDVHYFSTRGVICTCRGKVSAHQTEWPYYMQLNPQLHYTKTQEKWTAASAFCPFLLLCFPRLICVFQEIIPEPHNNRGF